MISFPNAKINLGLNIVEKRKDGFHNIETVFYPVPWKDGLEIIPSSEFKFSSSGISIDGISDHNLCVKVFKKLQQEYKFPEIQMHLHKNIPVGAGLGGGSADAAFTVQLLKSIFNLPLSEDEMEEIVRPMGSDCAFFVRNSSVYAFGKGDQFEKIHLNLKGKWIVLVYPNLHVSTKEAYDGIVATPSKMDIRDILKKDISQWKTLLQNDFEKSIFIKYPLLKDIKSQMYDAGASYACMSGSGSTVFGIFEKPIETDQWKNYRVQTGYLE